MYPLTRFSLAELSAARLDGHVFELGDGYMPADAAETPALRAATLTPRFSSGLVAIGATAAWVHGAVDALPHPLYAQRTRGDGRRHPRHATGMRMRDLPIEARDVAVLAGLAVSDRVRTLVDVTLDLHDPTRLTASAPCDAIRSAFSRLIERPATVAGAIAWLQRHPSIPAKIAAIATLRDLR